MNLNACPNCHRLLYPYGNGLRTPCPSCGYQTRAASSLQVRAYQVYKFDYARQDGSKVVTNWTPTVDNVYSDLPWVWWETITWEHISFETLEKLFLREIREDDALVLKLN